ncbi:hypothetical protein SynRS9915_00178 [Synechococcus sp. RS9915]|nr:hypothetical protein SynRS9915_00178 [Synechococcus sp. RS9915]
MERANVIHRERGKLINDRDIAMQDKLIASISTSSTIKNS